jgi:hypothetical protein
VATGASQWIKRLKKCIFKAPERGRQIENRQRPQRPLCRPHSGAFERQGDRCSTGSRQWLADRHPFGVQATDASAWLAIDAALSIKEAANAELTDALRFPAPKRRRR